MGREAKDIVVTPIAAVAASPGRMVGYPDNGRDKMSVQADVTLNGGTITYCVEGRLDSRFAWVKLSADLTASAYVEVIVAPEVRINVTAQTGTAEVTRAAVLMR